MTDLNWQEWDVCHSCCAPGSGTDLGEGAEVNPRPELGAPWARRRSGTELQCDTHQRTSRTLGSMRSDYPRAVMNLWEERRGYRTSATEA
jgi:hypothetical protein